MIVTTGKLIIVEGGYKESFRFEKDSRTPGCVHLQLKRSYESKTRHIELPGNQEEALQFVAAYMRTVNEPVGYKKSESENYKDTTDSELEELKIKVNKLPPDEQKQLIAYALEAWPITGGGPTRVKEK